MKKIISIGVALALLSMAVVPGAVAAADPDTYAKAPFSIMAEGVKLIGSLVDMADTKLGLGLGFSVAQFTTAIADFTAGPLAWTVDVLAWGLEILRQILDAVVPEFMPDMAWITDVVGDIVCKFYMPWGELYTVCNITPP